MDFANLNGQNSIFPQCSRIESQLQQAPTTALTNINVLEPPPAAEEVESTASFQQNQVEDSILPIFYAVNGQGVRAPVSASTRDSGPNEVILENAHPASGQSRSSHGTNDLPNDASRDNPENQENGGQEQISGIERIRTTLDESERVRNWLHQNEPQVPTVNIMTPNLTCNLQICGHRVQCDTNNSHTNLTTSLPALKVYHQNNLLISYNGFSDT